MPDITSLGIGSGLQLESIIEAFINAEAVPQEIRLQEKGDRLGLELSGVGSFRSSLSTFNDILENLTADDAFNQQVVSSSSSAIDVTSNGFASNGDFNIDVTQLATGSRLHSDNYTSSTDTVGSGTLTFGNGTDSFDVAIDPADTLSAIRDKINAESENFGVTANIINGGDSGSFLVFDSQVTGEDNALSVTTSDASLDGISTNNSVERIAQDAKIVIDASSTSPGTAVSSATNEFKNVIEDLTLTVNTVTDPDETALISIAQDDENGETLINDFIAGYNELVNNLTGLAAPTQGRLAFDSNVRQVKSELANIAIQAVNGLAGSFSSLNDIGIDLNRDGELQLSTFSYESSGNGQERLDSALTQNLSDVGELFASEGGIASQLASMIDSYISSDGILTQREDSLNERVASIADEFDTLETRLRSYEETLRAEFSFLDSTVAQFNATGDFLTAALASSPSDS